MRMRIAGPAVAIGLLAGTAGTGGPSGLLAQERSASAAQEQPASAARTAPGGGAEVETPAEAEAPVEAAAFRWTWTLRPTLTQRLAAAAGLLAPGDLPEGAAARGRADAGADVQADEAEREPGDGAIPTTVTVRAVAHDAKVIGSNVGGARITIRDAATGDVLAEGVQEGSTGDTRAIMVDPRPRGLTAYAADSEAAGFTATLELERPTRVEVQAEGPLGTPHAVQRATKTLLLVPGYDVVGEGLVLELNGFTVELLEAERAGETVDVRARVTMLCGCPTEPGGMWDADRIEVVAQVLEEGEVLAEAPLTFAGETSVYEGQLAADPAGGATVRVLAVDPERANLGMDERKLPASR